MGGARSSGYRPYFRAADLPAVLCGSIAAYLRAGPRLCLSADLRARANVHSASTGDLYPVAAAAPPCNCVSMSYMPDGSVVFTDNCTHEQAVATPAPPQTQGYN